VLEAKFMSRDQVATTRGCILDGDADAGKRLEKESQRSLTRAKRQKNILSTRHRRQKNSFAFFTWLVGRFW
jgi:hypothetical protein